jgi:hypothetical protein
MFTYTAASSNSSSNASACHAQNAARRAINLCSHDTSPGCSLKSFSFQPSSSSSVPFSQISLASVAAFALFPPRSSSVWSVIALHRPEA